MPSYPHTHVDKRGRVCTKCDKYKLWSEYKSAPAGINRKQASCRECGRVRNNRLVKAYQRRLKCEVVAAYGGVCACCGEAEIVFLTIDHINGDGARHRREIGLGGYRFYGWLKRNHFPEGFQVLCYNCNCAKSTQAYCPHQTTEYAKVHNVR
jgi:hypothetical protein